MSIFTQVNILLYNVQISDAKKHGRLDESMCFVSNKLAD